MATSPRRIRAWWTRQKLKEKFVIYSVSRAALALALVALPSWPQINTNLASAQPVAPISVKRGANAVAKVHVRLMPGYHMNSNTPADEYLIPLKLTWTPLPLEAIRTD